MITAILIILAAAFKAVADTLKWHYDVSIFKKLNPKWWNPAVSWEHVGFIKFTKYRPDAWHLANTGMIGCFILAVAVNDMYWPWYGKLAVCGTLFIVTFNTLWNKVLK